ncbi:hypothetical protein ON010_g3575 [Phytophthora cinnamomi]|nr:hypothetical protein ON010_g3575 [Phytophthora cinnamomi]
MSYRAISIINSEDTTVSGLALDATSAGNDLANSSGEQRSRDLQHQHRLLQQHVNRITGVACPAVKDTTYTDNTLSNVGNATVIHRDYSESEGGYTGTRVAR